MFALRFILTLALLIGKFQQSLKGFARIYSHPKSCYTQSCDSISLERVAMIEENFGNLNELKALDFVAVFWSLRNCELFSIKSTLQWFILQSKFVKQSINVPNACG